MKPNFPKVHSCTVNHPIEVFFGLTMDCGKQMGMADIVWNPTDANPDAERPEITCSDCREAQREQEPSAQPTWEYGFVDRAELRNFLEWREAS